VLLASEFSQFVFSKKPYAEATRLHTKRRAIEFSLGKSSSKLPKLFAFRTSREYAPRYDAAQARVASQSVPQRPDLRNFPSGSLPSTEKSQNSPKLSEFRSDSLTPPFLTSLRPSTSQYFHSVNENLPRSRHSGRLQPAGHPPPLLYVSRLIKVHFLIASSQNLTHFSPFYERILRCSAAFRPFSSLFLFKLLWYPK
jgi:hypothetical protein